MANKIKDKLRETLNATPKAVRWILLIAAFIVVLVLLFLLLNKPKQVAAPIEPNRDVQLIIEPKTANFSDTQIGTKAKQKFTIKATFAAIVESVTVKDSVDGFSIKSTCSNANINKDIPCVIDATFAPGNTDNSGDVTLVVKWHDKGEARDVNQKTANIVIPVSAKAAVVKPEPIPEPIPEPVIIPEPEPVFEPELEPEPIIGAEKNIFDEPVRPIESVAPRKKAPEKCSDFAMPGYSPSGAQIGWIKPKDGRYEFHPFADKDCNNPTGIYNPDTGIITSIDGKGKKIGTDADHLGGTVDVNTLPKLKSKPGAVANRTSGGEGGEPAGMGNLRATMKPREDKGLLNFVKNTFDKKALEGTATEGEAVYSSRPYDRTFILRQFKPIPATIVSEVRADPSVYGCNIETGKCDGGTGIPVRATVDRNVYSDNGRTVIIPTGTLLMGYLTGELPGPYKTIGRMKIKWYQFIRPDGVEFNFASDGQSPYSADSQGRVGVPGYGSTDYIEQMVMPLLTAMIPAAVNMIAPIADTFVNQIDLDNNTVVQSGTVRSSELAKNEVISAWNQVAQKLIVDALDNTVPPFSIAAGTRITVYSPVDLIATCGDDADGEKTNPNAGKKCAFHPYGSESRRKWSDIQEKSGLEIKNTDSSWTGQTRGFNLSKYCEQKNNVWTVKNDEKTLQEIAAAGYDYRTVLGYCQAQNYQAKNQAKYDAYYQNKTTNAKYSNTVEQDDSGKINTIYSDEFNKNVLGLEYEKDDEGNDTGIIKNPFEKPAAIVPEPVGSLDCDGQSPDQYGCCPGETYTDMGDQGFNCCPDGGGDCFPPLDMN